MTTLVLNRDAQPISLLPLSVISWQESIRYLVLEKASALSWYEDWIIHSAKWNTPVPAVIMLHEYQKPKKTLRFSKRNIFLRDQYSCQYCGISLKASEATIDHVIPISQGGRSTWENSTTACKPCNYRKGDKTKMKPQHKPYRPDIWELVDKRRRMGFDLAHPSWLDYLS
jgi:5-methylcytosine-specific restriction endonuclease McrA